MKNTKKLLALLLALVMLLALCACGNKSSDRSDDDDETASDPEAIAEKYVRLACEMDIAAMFDLCVFDYEQLIKDAALEDYADEEEFFEEISEEYGEEVDSWKDAFAAIKAEAKEELADEYGDDYAIQVEVIESVELPADKLEYVKANLLEDWDGYVNTNKVANISKGMEITVEVTFEGEYEEETDTITITMMKCDGKWKVATELFFMTMADGGTHIEEHIPATQFPATTTRPITTTAPTTTQPQPSATQPTVTPPTIPLGSWVYEGVTITFSFDGTGSLSEGSDYMAFTWKYQNGNLILVNEDGDETAVRYTVNGNTLTLINGDGETLDFTKKTASDSGSQTTASPAGIWETDGVTMILYTDGSGYIMVDDMSITLEWASTDNRISFRMSGEDYYGEYVISGNTLTIYYDDGTIEVWTKY